MTRLEPFGSDLRNRCNGGTQSLKWALQNKLAGSYIPICASCQKIRDDQRYWNQLEAYVQSRTEAQFSHSICSDCAVALYPEYLTKGA